jgi:hypothetical protein
MQAPPVQHARVAPPQVVGITHVPALHTRSPAHASAPAQHAVFSPPQPEPPSAPTAPRQTPLMQV